MSTNRMFAVGRTFVTLAFVLGISAVAHAGSISTGPLFSAGQHHADCLIRNVGTSPVNIPGFDVKIYGDGAGILTTIMDTCSGAALISGEVCFVRAAAVSSAMSCTAVVPGTGKTIRGSLEIRNSGDGTLVHEPLR